MTKLLQRLLDFVESEDGPTAVEYAVMLAMILLVCIAAIGILGQTLNSNFANSSDAIEKAMGGGS